RKETAAPPPFVLKNFMPLEYQRTPPESAGLRPASESAGVTPASRFPTSSLSGGFLVFLLETLYEEYFTNLCNVPFIADRMPEEAAAWCGAGACTCGRKPGQCCGRSNTGRADAQSCMAGGNPDSDRAPGSRTSVRVEDGDDRQQRRHRARCRIVFSGGRRNET